MKKIFIGILIVLLLLAAGGYVMRDTLGFFMMVMAVKPDRSFADDPRPPAPDYANPDHWAALPDRQDNADLSPGDDNLDRQATAAVDVFFIHPTTYYTKDHWVQPLDDEAANTITDEQVLTNQASVFNSCCRIYAPRYRQATLFSFMDDGDDGPAAIDFAYEDVKTAFRYFLDQYNDNRPFILAGHSQGALHADRLLGEMIRGTELEARLVAAYPVGYNLDGGNGIPVCETPTQTGCQVTWNAVAPDAPAFRDTSNDICVNPLSWTADGAYADFDQNLGAVSFTSAGAIEVGAMDAQCVGGRLHVTEVRSPNYDTRMFGPGNYHIYDFSFFHMNIRENALARVGAYLAATQ